MSQRRKYLVCVSFDLSIDSAEGPFILPSDRVFVVVAEGDQAACTLATTKVLKQEGLDKIRSCSSRLLNTVLSSSFFALEEGGDDANG